MTITAYEKAPEADEDLESIVIYTADKWGVDQVRKYMSGIEQCMESLAAGKSFSKNLNDLMAGLRIMHCQRHYIFGLERDGSPMLILAVLHERMDLITRLQERLKN
jgi:plasmid stabilization system protein ParE